MASFLQRLGRTGRRPGATRNCLFLATSQRAFLQAGGLLHLWEKGFVEPISAPRFPAHLVAQQLIALVLQEGRIARNTCLQRLGRVADFRKVDSLTIDEILKHLVEHGFFVEDAGFLIIGDASQSEFDRKNFLELVSAFTSPPVFKVLHGTKELGSIDQNLLWNMQATDKRLLRLAGRDWEIASIDWKARFLYVTSTKESGRPMWLGQGEALSFQLCQAIKQLLLDEDLPGWLTRRGIEALSTARDEHGYLRRNPSGYITIRQGLEWHTYAGGHLNLVISQALSSALLAEVRSSDFAISIDKSAHADFVAIRGCLESLDRKTLLSTVQVSLQWLDNLKFSTCLPEEIAKRVFIEKLNVDEWDEMILTWFGASGFGGK